MSNEDRRQEREADARRKRRQELEARIENTAAGFDWLHRVKQIGKGGERIVTADEAEVDEEERGE